MTLLATLREFFKLYGVERTYWLGFSGGLDSHVLLSLCHQLTAEFKLKLRAIHINHGLSAQATQFEQHCAIVCANYGIDFIARKIKVDLTVGDSLEEKARKTRYQTLVNYLAIDDMLLTAHQQDDQAETVLLQLFRGAGPKGLAAMPMIKAFGRGYHARPLLNMPRIDLIKYAEANQLIWIDDESNSNTRLSRNFIRHEILPLIKHRWPSVTQTLMRSANHCAEAQLLLDNYAKQLCEEMRGSKQHTLSVKKLLQQDDKYQRLILRTWIHQHGFPLPDAKKMTVIQSDVLRAAWDRLPRVCWQHIELRRYRDDIFLIHQITSTSDKCSYPWDFSHPLCLNELGVLHANKVLGRGLRIDLVTQATIRFREGGEVIYLQKRGRHHTLKNLLQEWDVLPWERNRIPLIFVGEKLVAAVGYYADENYLAKDNEYGYEVRLQLSDL